MMAALEPIPPPHDEKGRNLSSPFYRFRHVKTGGMYRVIAIGRLEATLEPVVIYRDATADDPPVWVRPLSEWVDGRFQIVENQ
jgi:hypothetical protein